VTAQHSRHDRDGPQSLIVPPLHLLAGLCHQRQDDPADSSVKCFVKLRVLFRLILQTIKRSRMQQRTNTVDGSGFGGRRTPQRLWPCLPVPHMAGHPGRMGPWCRPAGRSRRQADGLPASRPVAQPSRRLRPVARPSWPDWPAGQHILCSPTALPMHNGCPRGCLPLRGIRDSLQYTVVPERAGGYGPYAGTVDVRCSSLCTARKGIERARDQA